MKKIMIIGRPYSNGGDYLIFERVQRAIQDYYPEAEITMNLQNDNLFDIEELNTYDAVVTGGGGAQFSEQYIRSSFLFQHFDELTVPIHYMGTGLYGADGRETTVYEMEYSDEIKEYFQNVIAKGGQVASRDWTVDTVLRHNGIEGVLMAGCPAWYDLETLKRTDKEGVLEPQINWNEIRKIAVSNHGLTKNAADHAKRLEQIEKLILCLQDKFPQAQVMLTFNDGYVTKYSTNYNKSLQEWAQSHKVTCVDLSGDATKFHDLDGIDLHIGFRVHTHIYCISRLIPSILIEEDIRGFGMNETLQLPHIQSYAENSKPDAFAANPYLNVQIEVLLEQAKRYNRLDYQKVFYLIKQYYEKGMKQWLKNLQINGS